jgi:hypothetical protein
MYGKENLLLLIVFFKSACVIIKEELHFYILMKLRRFNNLN